ncbi:MAG: ATP-binding cassette domain-containing protein [Planctomycetota bacterium]|jgi:molybdate/tungstate transport system ATP-binding protein|nr:ATP-binding cassette domain-containing protein [Planctomycetota bacterium]
MIELQNLSIAQGRFSLTNINLKIDQGDYAILMGETGCGKTTLIESICGLRPLDQGKIILGGRDVTQLPTAARHIGYVPQDASLFPTMRVDHQILFGLEVRHVDQSTRLARLNELADKLSIQKILKRYPNRLSGGERQRVALARAIAFRPQLLCLDEPLSAIDGKTHAQLLDLLRSIHESESVTILHITHNLNEARELGTVRFRFESGSIQLSQEN